MQVKSELNELFDFIAKDFKKATKTALVIVAFVDDLDRCLKGRNVKVLEAMQLILSKCRVCKAKIMRGQQMAIDRRIVDICFLGGLPSWGIRSPVRMHAECAPQQ